MRPKTGIGFNGPLVDDKILGMLDHSQTPKLVCLFNVRKRLKGKREKKL